MIVLAYDIVSEGERLQHYDPELGASKVGRPTGEHSLAAWQTAPVGDHVSRYFIWDAIRGLDYLAARPDVDAQRLGAFGCSGGGTITAFLSALDERVKATATACYVTDFDHLLADRRPAGRRAVDPRLPGRGPRHRRLRRDGRAAPLCRGLDHRGHVPLRRRQEGGGGGKGRLQALWRRGPAAAGSTARAATGPWRRSRPTSSPSSPAG
jgi:hypothetical protein